MTDQQTPSTDLDQFEARVKAAAAVVENAATSIESEWGDGNGYDVYEAARLLGADVYVGNFVGPDVPGLVAELRILQEENQEHKETAAAMVTLATRREIELRAAHAARGELQALHSDLHDYDLTAASANRLRRILTTWDEQAAEGGGR
jgi:hypothetical protein